MGKIVEVPNPRVILGGLVFKIGQSGQLRFKRIENETNEYDVTMGMSGIGAVFQDRQRLWLNRNVKEHPPEILEIGGLQIIYYGGTTISRTEEGIWNIDNWGIDWGEYIKEVYDSLGSLQYSRSHYIRNTDKQKNPFSPK